MGVVRVHDLTDCGDCDGDWEDNAAETEIEERIASLKMASGISNPEEKLRQEHIRSLYKLDRNCPTTEILPGLHMPLVGLGTWRGEANEVKEAVLTAVRMGYRHIDCAMIYQNEDEVGEALTQIFEEGVVKREDLWITSKLWNTDHGRDRVLPAVKRSLSLLKLDYLNEYLIHWPFSGEHGSERPLIIEETWEAMESLVEMGLVKCIGVSNFSIAKIQKVLSYAKIPPAVNQVEVHPYFRNDKLIQWCKENKIHVTAYSPLGGSPESENLVKKTLPRLLENPIVGEIAEKTGKSKGQVLIRWALQHGTSVLPKSVKPTRIEMNFDVLDWTLTEEDFKALSSLEPQTRMLDGSFFVNPKGPYTSVAEIWDE